jgi:hypothetical protein
VSTSIENCELPKNAPASSSEVARTAPPSRRPTPTPPPLSASATAEDACRKSSERRGGRRRGRRFLRRSHLSLHSFTPSGLPSSLRPGHGRRPDPLLWRSDPRAGGLAPCSTNRSRLITALAAFDLGGGGRAHGLVAAASFRGGHGGGVRHCDARLGRCVGCHGGSGLRHGGAWLGRCAGGHGGGACSPATTTHAAAVCATLVLCTPAPDNDGDARFGHLHHSCRCTTLAGHGQDCCRSSGAWPRCWRKLGQRRLTLLPRCTSPPPCRMLRVKIQPILGWCQRHVWRRDLLEGDARLIRMVATVIDRVCYLFSSFLPPINKKCCLCWCGLCRGPNPTRQAVQRF